MSQFTNPLATPEQLYRRSTFSSLPTDLQEVIFFATQCLTQAAGLLLELPQAVTAQANVLIARYWLIDSPMLHEYSDVSAAAIYIVSKMGPMPRSPRDVSTVYAYLLSSSSSFFRPTTKPDPRTFYQTDTEQYAFQQRMLEIEARISYSLAYDFRVALPHPLAITYLQTLDFAGVEKEEISRRTTQYLNTALLSPQMLYITHQPHALAAAAIYLTAREGGAKLPTNAWWEVFDVDREELGFLVVAMKSLNGWMSQRKDELPALMGESGMVTLEDVYAELRKRGLMEEDKGKQPAGK